MGVDALCSDLLGRVGALLTTGQRPNRWVLALSGGGDSLLLLELLAALRGRLATPLVATHIDHNLHPDSAQWAESCAAHCRRLDVPLTTIVVEVTPGGEGLEAAARRARYAALRPMIGENEALVTAHHRDDQIETLLLQLLRGAGVRGLAAMASESRFGQGSLLRPLLGIDRSAIDYCRQRLGLEAVDDPANRSLHFDRNYLRHQILPRLRRRWPQLNQTIARSAMLLGEAETLLQAAAADDLAAATGTRADNLRVDRLLALPAPRRYNLLRHWLRQLALPMPPRERLLEVDRSLLSAAIDRQPQLVWRGGELRRHRNLLYAIDPTAGEVLLPVEWVNLGEPCRLADGRRLQLLPAGGPGLDRRLLAGGELVVRPADPGERCALGGDLRRRRLRRYLSEAGVPPWERSQQIALELRGELVAVVGIGIATNAMTKHIEHSLSPCIL